MKTLYGTFLLAILCYNFSYAQITWEKINGPLYPATPYSFLITSNGTQFMGTDNTGLFRSTDDGQTWDLKNSGLTGDRITSLAAALNGTIYAGMAAAIYGLSRSTDNGETWQNKIYDVEVQTIKINSLGHIFVGTNSGFYKSTNNGAIWSAYNNGLLNLKIRAIEVVTDSTLYVATDQGIHKTTNEGYNWIPKSEGIIPSGNYIATNSVFLWGDTLFVNTTDAVYYSTNFGEHWIQRASLSWPIYDLQIDSNYIFYLRQDLQKNLLRSFDYGITWDTVYTFPDWFMYFNIFNNRMYAGVYSEGLFVSSDSGNSFQDYFIYPFIPQDVSFFKIKDKNLWIAGTYSFGVFTSSDEGLTWDRKGPFKLGASHIQINSRDEIFVNCNNVVNKSTDNCNSWETIPPPAFANNLYYLALSYDDKLYASYDNGFIVRLNNENSWDSLANLDGGDYTRINHLIVDKYNDAYISINYRYYPNYYYYYTLKGIDDFSSFETLFNTGSQLAYNDSGYVFFGNSKMYRTTDRGNTIEEINNGITNLNAYSIKVIDFNEVYVGDYNKIYVTTNNGELWHTIPGPSDAHGIHSIEKVEDGFLIIGANNGIYKNTTVLSIDNQSNVNIRPEKFSLSQNYPNPFNPTTSIQYSVSSRQYITLKVYDVLGNEVATLVNEEKPAGSYIVKFSAQGGSASGGDGSSLASGIYFYQLKAGSYTATKKLILLK